MLCLDTFTSKYTKEVMSKWRPATVCIYDGSNKTTKALIHFDGWKDKFDKWVDLAALETGENLEIAPFGLLSASQIEVGARLTAQQQKVAMEFLCNGSCEASEEMEVDTAATGDDTDRTVGRKQLPKNQIHLQSIGKGMIVDVLDVFTREGQGQHVSFNWRKACVMEVAGSKLRVGYLGLGSEFDEIIDLLKEKGRVRDSGTMEDIQRAVQRADNSDAASTVSPSRPHPHDSHASPASFAPLTGNHFSRLLCRSCKIPMSLDWNKSAEEDSELDSPVDPAALLANKEAHTRQKPQPAQSNRRRQISFTSKGGQVLPGAAVGYSPERYSASRRHSTSVVESGRRESTEIAFEERLERMGLHLVEIEADGNCLFCALASPVLLR